MPRSSPLASVLVSLFVFACAQPAPEPAREPGLPGGAESVSWTVERSSPVVASAPVAEPQDPRPRGVEAVTPATAKVRVFLRGGPKTHGPGEHEHQRFLAEWQPLLES